MAKGVRRKRLSVEGVARIAQAIKAIDASRVVSWRDVQQLATQHAGSGYEWTRQALERHAAIKNAYLEHESSRKKLKSGKRSGRRLSEPEKVARLEHECAELRKRLDKYDERFATYLANAVAHGLTVEQLSRPLERPARGAGNSDKV